MRIFIHNLKLVFRNSQKHKRFFIISVLSLAIGIATSCLLLLHISYEKSYDKFYHQTDNIYRVNYKVTQNGKQLINSARTPSALSYVLPFESSLVEASSRVLFEECYMYTENVKLFNQKVVWADSSFLNVFQLDMVLGDVNSSLVNKYSVVISDKVAQIYFGEVDPIGKRMKLNEGIEFSVTGVFKELPATSHLTYDFITSFSTLEDYGIIRSGNWGGNWVSTYIRIKEAASKMQIESTLSTIAAKYMADRKEKGQIVEFSLMPVKDIYLHSDVEGEYKPQGSATKITLLTIIALFLIVIAWANTINIATALSFERAKQSGIRKLNGANKTDLFQYHIVESFFINSTAILLSVVFLFAALPVFKTMVKGAIEIHSVLHIWSWAIVGLFLISGVLFTGILPAILQSSFNTLQLLKNSKGDKFSFNTFRKSLAVFQFTLAIILIGSTTLILKQIQYLESRDLGINANQVLVMRGPATNNTTGEKRYTEFQSFRQELLQSPYFVSVTATMNVPGQTNRYKNVIISRNGKQIDASFNRSFADENYFATYQVPIIEGRNFYDIKDNELNSLIINEKAAEAIGFENAISAIGSKINIGNSEKEIVGVAKNFHHESLQKELEPYIYEFRHPQEFGYYPALISTANLQEAINTAGKVWEKHYPDALFDSFFLDQFFNKQYLSYKQLGEIVGVSALLAILIACLGLYAQVSYSVNKKVKEIGVRKVNGAKIYEVLLLLNKDFIKWVAIAFLIACPVAWFAMHKWLENFAYKTTLSWWIFALAGLLALGIALLTVSWQSWRAATRNPVEALRYE